MADKQYEHIHTQRERTNAENEAEVIFDRASTNTKGKHERHTKVLMSGKRTIKVHKGKRKQPN